MKAARLKSTFLGTVASCILVVATMSGGAVLNTNRASAVFPGPFPQCPAIGWDLSCEILIQINTDGSVTVLKDPGEGSYDGVEDTLIGVQNNSSFGIKSMDLTGVGGAFAFDGDGLCNIPTAIGPNTSTDNTTPTFAGNTCNYGPTKYEGPGTSFTNYGVMT